MKKLIYITLFLILMHNAQGQQLMKLRFLGAGEAETPFATMWTSTDFDNETIVAVMGGLNDWDGMNNYFNVYGSKVLIESKDIAYNGIINITLRREDGRNFYGIYPTIRAQLVNFEIDDALTNPELATKRPNAGVW